MGFDDRPPKIDADILDLQTYNYVKTFAYARSVLRFLLSRDPARYRVSFDDPCTGSRVHLRGTDFLMQYETIPETRRMAWDVREALRRHGIIA